MTAITADAPQNVEFYAGVLGLRIVKKTVNQDDPTVYHLFYADERGSAGSDITFFEYPACARGRAGDGMVHRVVSVCNPATRSTSGSGGSSARASRRTLGRLRPLSRSGGPRPRARRRHVGRRAAARTAFGDPPGPCDRRLRRSARVQQHAGGERRPLRDHARVRSRRRELVDRARQPARRLLPLRHASGGAAAQRGGHRAPRRVGLAHGDTTTGGPASPPPRHDSVDRPLLFPVDLFPRAFRSPIRDRDPRPGFTAAKT